MSMLDYFWKLNRNIIDQIQYRGTMVTGVITADNGNGTYAVKIAQADEAYPYVETAFADMVFGVDEVVLITFEYGNKEMPRILGYAKRISQHPIDVESDYSGEGGDPITTVETLDAYSIVLDTAYLEGRISLSEGTGNCTRRGFQYGLTTSYGLDTHTDGSYGEGSYAMQVAGLPSSTIVHFRAYVKDADDNFVYGEDKTFQTATFVIDIGLPAIYRGATQPQGHTHILRDNPANASGVLTKIEIYARTELSGCEVATFYLVTGTTFSTRDVAIIGSVGEGKQIFSVSLNVVVGDYIGIYWTEGYLEKHGSGGLGYWQRAGDYIPCTEQVFGVPSIDRISLYGEG